MYLCTQCSPAQTNKLNYLFLRDTGSVAEGFMAAFKQKVILLARPAQRYFFTCIVWTSKQHLFFIIPLHAVNRTKCRASMVSWEEDPLLERVQVLHETKNNYAITMLLTNKWCNNKNIIAMLTCYTVRYCTVKMSSIHCVCQIQQSTISEVTV